MYDEIYQLLDKYNSKKRFIDKKFVLDTCDIIKYGLDLYDIVGKCHCDKTLHNFGNYNIATCEMNFNPKKKHNRDMKRFFPDIYYIMYNSFALEGIFHEFSHAILIKKCYENLQLPEDKQDKILDNIISLILMDFAAENLTKEHYRYYQNNHDKFIYEKYANINSSKMFNEILNRFPKDLESTKSLQTTISLQHQKFVIEGYKLEKFITNSPSFDYFKDMPNSEKTFPILVNLDFFNDINLPYDMRTIFGFVLSSIEYKDLLIEHIETMDKYKKLIKK